MRDAFWATCLDALAGYDIESAEDEICSELDNIATLRKSAASRRHPKTVLLQSIRMLPLTARRAVDIARRVGVPGFVAEGDAGVIRGALDDDAAFRSYPMESEWRRSTSF
jgi:hypothetical protein